MSGLYALIGSAQTASVRPNIGQVLVSLSPWLALSKLLHWLSLVAQTDQC
jgi:hypothetical protein